MQETHITDVVGNLTTIGPGPHGYQRMARSEIGAVLLSEGPEEMGQNLTLKGEQLEVMRMENYPDAQVVDWALSNGGHAARLDLAHDIFASTLKPLDLWELYQDGLSKTAARQDKRFTAKEGTDDGFYLGSTKSDKFLRVYNKGKEQGQDKEAWARLELVCRRLVARAYFQNMGAAPTCDGFIRKAIVTFADFPSDLEYQIALSLPAGEIPTLPRKLSHFWAWIERQVIPALVTRESTFPDEDVLGAFLLFYQKEKARRNLPAFLQKQK